jgi:hypothetical protein
MVPFKLAKTKLADAPFPPFPTAKDEVFVLATWPVGPTAPIPPGGMAILPSVFKGAALVTLLLGVTA